MTTHHDSRPGARLGRGPRSRHGHRSDRRIWWTAFGLFSAAMVLWSLAMPLYSSPDENAHVIKAAAVARGQLLGRDQRTTVGDTLTHVTVPAALAGRPPCFAGDPTIAASCARPGTTSTKPVDATTLAGHYPPLYYALVGTGSLLVPGPGGLYAMRFLSGLLSAAFLASALLSTRRWRSGLGPLAVAVATTPMVLFMGAGVNPSGLEITAAACAWASALSLLARPEVAGTRLTVRLGIAASAMVLSRGLSPLWLAVILLTVVAASGRQPVRTAFSRPDVRICSVTVLLAGVGATGWILFAGALTLRPTRSRVPLPLSGAIAESWHRYPFRLKQMVGVFGWLDTPSPAWTLMVWAVLTALLVALALVTAPHRGRIALVLLLGAVLALPVLIEASQQRTLGFVWQGRYTLPIATGIPLLAAHLVTFPRTRSLPAIKRRLNGICLRLLVTAQVAAFWWNLKRNTVGNNGGLGLLHTSWSPPLPPLLLLLLFTTAVTAAATVTWSAADLHGTRPPGPRAPGMAARTRTARQ